MAKSIPITVKNDEEWLDLLGRHDNIESLKRHMDMQLKGMPNSKFAIFLYVEVPNKKSEAEKE